MNDLATIYENHLQRNFYSSSPSHESRELTNVKRTESHIKTLEALAHDIENPLLKKRITHELKFIREYINEMINLHSSKL